MNGENDRYIDDVIGNVLKDNVPADVDRRLRSQLEEFRSQLGEMEKPAARRAMALRRIWLGASAAAAATIAVAAVIGWSLWPGVTLADVAAAVLQQPWIHVTGTSPDGKPSEFWYSPPQDISAWHDNEWIEYRDHRLSVYYAYDLHDKVLYRVPEEMRRGMEHFASMIASLRVLLQSEQPVEKPLERLGLLGSVQRRYDVIKQTVEKVKLDGREWLDYHLIVKGQDTKLPGPIQSQMLFRVAPGTKLLSLVRCEYEWKGQHVIAESRFDYPEKGPADVYDLGVPKTAKVVDRVPTNELARILETIRAGRQRMDDYRAIVVRQMEGASRPSGFPEIIYRKGDKFRRDTAIWTEPSILSDPKIKWPMGGKGAGDWWKKCIEDRCFLLPMSIDRGSTAYTIKHRQVDDPDGSVRTEITGVEKREDKGRLGGETYPGLWSWMPEFACRPPLGIPHETMDAILDPNPKEGPPGTILLRVRRVGPKRPPVQNQEGKVLPSTDAWRNWLDSSRDYVVVRSDMVVTDGGKEGVNSTVIDELARSPQGTWYATRIRTKGAIRTPSDGKTYDEIIDLYVDFNAKLPDSLFEPPSPGRIH